MSVVARIAADITQDERDQLLKQFEVSGLRYDEFAKEHNINPQTFKNWVWHSKRPGGKPAQYTSIERKKIVESFLAADLPLVDFAKTWGVSSGTLGIWVQRYRENGAEGLMNRRPGEKDRRRGAKTPESIKSEIIKIKKKEPEFGLKKIKQWMYRFRGVNVSTGAVRKTVLAEGLPLVKVKKKKHRSSEKVRRFERARPMQLWQSDITQMTVGQHSMKVYLTVFMDDHSRFIVGWRLQSRQTAELVLDAFKDAVVKYGKPEEVLTDQGRQYFAWRGKSELEKLLEKENIKHVVSRAHHPQTLGKCERFWETIGNEFWTRVRPFDLEEARERLKYFIDHYNYQRPHQGIDGQVPADRFFGIAADVRAVLEKSVVENSLKIAIGELPKPPAFLIGQVGDQRIAFHGTSGAFFLTHENINGEIKNGNTGSSNNTCTHTAEQSTQAEPEAAACESITSDTSTGVMGESDGGRSFTSAKEISHYNGILAGTYDQARGGTQPRDSADPIMAIQQSSYFGNECRAFSESEETKDGIYE